MVEKSLAVKQQSSHDGPHHWKLARAGEAPQPLTLTVSSHAHNGTRDLPSTVQEGVPDARLVTGRLLCVRTANLSQSRLSRTRRPPDVPTRDFP